MKPSGLSRMGSLTLSLAWARLFGLNVPLVVSFRITAECNASCDYCLGGYNVPHVRKEIRELSTEQCFFIIDELAGLGTRRIGIGGGEPLLRKDIGKIVAYVKKNGISCGMSTNGFLVPDRIEDIRKLDTITISLDGDKEAHEANRGKGTFKKVMEAIKVAKAHKIPVHVSTTITKNNMHSVDYVMELGKKIGCLVKIKPFYRCILGDIDNNFPELLKRQERVEVINRIISYKKKGYPVFYSYKTYEYLANWPDLTKERITDQEPEFDHAKCYMGRYFCYIDVNGNVSPCTLLSKVKFKNCLEVGLGQALNDISQHNCKACCWACNNEYNLVFGLDLGVILNTARNFFKNSPILQSSQMFLGREGIRHF